MTDKADVLVVGGGLIGTGLAWRLALGGASVILVEAGDLNAGASGQNAGSLHFQLERRFLEQDEAAMLQASPIAALSRLAVDDWRGLEAQLGADLHVAMDGGLMVAETAEEVRLLEKKRDQEAVHGLKTDLLDGDQARAIAPYLSPSILAASHAPYEGHADPRAVTPAFARAASAAGVSIRLSTRLLALGKSGGGFRATVRDGAGRHDTIEATSVVLAAGVATRDLGELCNLHLPVFAAPLMLSATERTPSFIPHLVQHVGQRLSMKQTHSGNVLIGGGWPSRFVQKPSGGLDLYARPIVDPAALDANLRIAVRVAPQVADLNLLRTWTGATSVTADQLPLVGPVRALPGLYVATGGSGFTLGPTFARLLAAQILGDAEAADALRIVSPARFDHLNSFMG